MHFMFYAFLKTVSFLSRKNVWLESREKYVVFTAFFRKTSETS